MDKHRQFIVNHFEEEKLSLSFTFAGKSSEMKRQRDEPISSALQRIQANVVKHAEKLSRKKAKFVKLDDAIQAEVTESLTECFAVGLKDRNGAAVDGDLSSVDSWKDGHVISFGETEFTVEVNPPTISAISLPDVIMIGFPVHPRIQSEFVDFAKSEFHWRKKAEGCDLLNGDPIHSGFSYVPTISDINCKLSVTVRPSNGAKFGGTAVAFSPNPVDAGPGRFPFELRQEFTAEVTGPGALRLLSYNVLANMYATTEGAAEVFYPHCSPNYLHIDYRKPIFTRELIGYNADILALQEVDEDVFQHDLRPCLKDLGFQGLFTNKGSNLPEGEALFFRESKLRLISRHDIVLKDFLIAEIQGPGNSDGVCGFIKDDETLLDQVVKRQTIVQVALLEAADDPGSKLCVANTHLYFHPLAPHIRLAQLALITKHLETTILKFQADNPSVKSTPLVFCGDFNSTPGSGGFEYLSSGRIPRSHADWTRHREVINGGFDLKHSFPLVNACGIPEFTNLIPKFRGVLDYIFVDKDVFHVDSVVPMPSYDDIAPYVALPNAVFPSDHIALVCDVLWRK